ncbi:oxygenase MpaB family protein [Marmoricola endophyticus]|nr:oxygenase MpaB family protein [Marmoricola endophyticus]
MSLDRTHWQRHVAALDAESDFEEIYRILAAHEFPWDMNQSLGLALYRTYAVPSIGGLLARTGEFTERTQKRYDDTALILEAASEHGLESPQGRRAVRRMNQMHGFWNIPQDDLRYVLCTFVVVPIRWLDEYGYRPLTEHEKVASANYYRRLGRLMNIKDVPATWRAFGEAMDAYEAERFGYDAGAVAVSEATLDLMATFPPQSMLPAWLVRRFSKALMDDALLDAFGYARPSALERLAFRGGVKLRARFVATRPARERPSYVREMPQIRSYPDGYDVADLGTFPSCPHADGAATTGDWQAGAHDDGAPGDLARPAGG